MSHRISSFLGFIAPLGFLIGCLPGGLLAQYKPQHYIVYLEDAPPAERFASREQVQSGAAANYRAGIEAKQAALKQELASRNFQVVGSVSTLLNALFVATTADRLAELQSVPGVKGVVAGRRFHANLNRATGLMNGPAAWSAAGGTQSAGAGIKIAMIDTGIDQTHPAFQDSALTPPAGFPICKTAYPNGSEVAIANCAQFTNNKVIVARSYVPLDAAGSDLKNPAPDSTPDDYTPRDRIGHGTGTASAAAGVSNTSGVNIVFNGMAPKAFLGNYKVFGSPEVNDFAGDSAIILALEDALKDGMDVASLSLGGPALSGPLDTGAACGNAAGVPCDDISVAVENAVKAGMVVVIAAGNDGDGASSYNAPTLGSVSSPGGAPDAITVGSTTNSHYMTEGVEVPGSGVPSNLQQISGSLGDGPFPSGATTAPLVDVTTLGDSGLGCSAFPSGSLSGSFALIERGSCAFVMKVTNAQNAGALGVIFYMADSSAIIAPGGLTSTNIPAIMISNADGVALKTFIDSNADHSATIDPSGLEQLKTANLVNLLSYYSSVGPMTGTNSIKPEVVATGGSDNYFTDIYLATQSYDPLSDMYSATRYTSGSGTSFATPLVSGSAALVKQAHPTYTPAQIKSALVNTAAQTVTQDEASDTMGVQQLGGGLLDANAARGATLTASPSTLSFGSPASLPMTLALSITNTGTSSASLSIVVTPGLAASGATVSVDHPSLSLAAGATGALNVVLSGALPAAGGAFSGFVTIQSSGTTLHIPYMFYAPTPTIGNLVVLASPNDSAPGSDAGPIIVRLVDSNGLGVAGQTVSFTASSGGSLKNVQATTNSYGIASAEAFLGSQVASYTFNATGAGMAFQFSADALPQPAITSAGVVNAASFASGSPIAPGSYISIFGSNLSRISAANTGARLPLAINYITVSFDVPSAGLSLPGHLVYTSPTQVNLQVPWELQGQTSVQMKVLLGDGFGVSFGNVVTVPLANYAPAFFANSGAVAALDSSNRIITGANAAQPGKPIQLFANGLGPVNNQPASGDPVTSASSTCTTNPTLMIANQSVPISFCGLAPGFAGLYQVNATVPSGLAAGTYPITIAAGGATSPAVNLTVQ